MVTATPNWLKPEDSANVNLLPPSEDIITRQFEYRDGSWRAPDGPGLGVEIDEKRFEQAERRYELKLNKWRARLLALHVKEF
ncbi:MAG: hypothetical protein NWF13_05655 [Candidatus Bathyarchaeota archaeon]|nr:hypothetical protein [Candidatus Bathyarchaeota archaeon]